MDGEGDRGSFGHDRSKGGGSCHNEKIAESSREFRGLVKSNYTYIMSIK